MDKWGNWITSWGTYGRERDQLRLPKLLPNRTARTSDGQ